MSALQAAFLSQAESCEALDSPFMGQLLRLLATHWPEDTALAAKCATFEGDISPKGHSLPLRIAGGLHALVLQGKDEDLTAVYPPNKSEGADLQNAVLTALRTHDAFLTDWITHAPQTNEVRRAAVLIATAHLLADRFGLPIKLSELGASAGLNLMFDQFHLDVGEGYGPHSTVALSPDWTGPLPPQASVTISNRRGVDLNPLNSANAEDALRLQSYLWADQEERLHRTQAAIALNTAGLDQDDAISWLDHRLSAPNVGELHMVYSTVAWQYFPEKRQNHGTALMEAAGEKATEAAPLAWLSYEADDIPHGAALTLRLWPGNHTIPLGRADFHGRWVEWQAPTKLP
ncbi:DUF2332 domain-containing protein [Shimia sp.]|uniref:DUF2332 domain-containing protein n=1 Tax=unclassified Shimia TaxID=2630038 RepID=UPI0025E57D9E|nr:DUF2332 family protein [Shimia sp.]MCH2066177.1 DUF2332 family protein [Shimia sp.]